MRKSLLSASLAFVLTGFGLPVNAANLMDAFKDAVQNDPQTLKAKAQYDVIKENERLAFANLLPQVGFEARYVLSNSESYVSELDTVIKPEVDTLSYGFSLSQSIFNMGNWYQLDAAEKRALQAQTGFDLAQQALITRVASAYFNVLKAQDNLAFVEAEKNAIGRQLEQTKQRFNVGLTAITDVHEAQANYDSAIAQEIRAKNDIEIAKEALREITGKYYNNIDGLNTSRFTATMPQPMKAQQWVETAQQSNLELKTKELVVEAAKFDIKRASAGHYPTLTFGASIGNEDMNGDIDRPALDSTVVSLTLNVPLYVGGATSAAVRQAQANYVLASEDMELTYRSIVRQVRSSYADVVALVSTLKAFEQSVVSAESALKATQAGFEVGTRTIVDVLNSTRNLYNAKRNLSNTRYDYILAMLVLKQASGLLNQNDIDAVNQGLIAG